MTSSSTYAKKASCQLVNISSKIFLALPSYFMLITNVLDSINIKYKLAISLLYVVIIFLISTFDRLEAPIVNRTLKFHVLVLNSIH